MYAMENIERGDVSTEENWLERSKVDCDELIRLIDIVTFLYFSLHIVEIDTNRWNLRVLALQIIGERIGTKPQQKANS